MDLEKAIEFLLKSQARADARFNARFDRAEERFRQAETRMDRAETRMDRAEARMDRLEQVVALNNRIVSRVVRYGVSLRSDVRRTERELQKLAQAQAATQRALKTFIETASHRNGRGSVGQK